MVIRIFTFTLLFLAILSYLVPVENKSKKSIDNDIALLTFNDSTMYTLTPDNMNRIIYAKQVLRYRNRDVMYDGALMVKSMHKQKGEITDTLLSDLIIRRGDDFKFLNNVKFTRNDYLSLNTNELLYNAKTKVARNTLAFKGTYFENYMEGKNIYLDLNKYYMKADETHFEIEIRNNKGK